MSVRDRIKQEIWMRIYIWRVLFRATPPALWWKQIPLRRSIVLRQVFMDKPHLFDIIWLVKHMIHRTHESRIKTDVRFKCTRRKSRREPTRLARFNVRHFVRTNNVVLMFIYLLLITNFSVVTFHQHRHGRRVARGNEALELSLIFKNHIYIYVFNRTAQ